MFFTLCYPGYVALTDHLGTDFTQVALTGPMVGFIAPGQMHHNLDFDAASGWLMFVTPRLVLPENREILDNSAMCGK